MFENAKTSYGLIELRGRLQSTRNTICLIDLYWEISGEDRTLTLKRTRHPLLKDTVEKGAGATAVVHVYSNAIAAEAAFQSSVAWGVCPAELKKLCNGDFVVLIPVPADVSRELEGKELLQSARRFGSKEEGVSLVVFDHRDHECPDEIILSPEMHHFELLWHIDRMRDFGDTCGADRGEAIGEKLVQAASTQAVHACQRTLGRRPDARTSLCEVSVDVIREALEDHVGLDLDRMKLDASGIRQAIDAAMSYIDREYLIDLVVTNAVHHLTEAMAVQRA